MYTHTYVRGRCVAGTSSRAEGYCADFLWRWDSSEYPAGDPIGLPSHISLMLHEFALSAKITINLIKCAAPMLLRVPQPAQEPAVSPVPVCPVDTHVYAECA